MTLSPATIPATGKEVWRADVLNPTNAPNYRIISSPLIAGGLIIAPSRVNPLVALRPGGVGDISQSHVAWTFHRGPDVPSPVSDGIHLYLVSETGVVYCLDLKTGALIYGPTRLPNDFYSSSPVLADGKIYITGETTGVTTVFRAGRRSRSSPRIRSAIPAPRIVSPPSQYRRGNSSSRRMRTSGCWANARTDVGSPARVWRVVL